MTNTDMFRVRYLNAMNNKLENYGKNFYIHFIFNTQPQCRKACVKNMDNNVTACLHHNFQCTSHSLLLLLWIRVLDDLCHMTTTDHMATYTIRKTTNHMDEKLRSCDYDRPRPQINNHGRHAEATNATL
jgi:hypothetical protein